MAGKQVIVVVHGVGVREAGAAGNMVSAAVAETPTGSSHLYRRDTSDDFLLAEGPAYASRGMTSVFPARLIRFEGAGGATARGERVIADFYWGDITGTGTTLVRVIMGFFKLILGLSHAIRENAREVFAGDRPGDGIWRRVAESAALTIHGPIFAINVVLVAGFLAAVLAGWLFARLPAFAALSRLPVAGDLAALAVAVLAVIAGRLIRRRCKTYLERFFGGWLAVTGIVLALSAAVSALDLRVFGLVSWFDGTSLQLNCGWAGSPADVDACKSRFGGIFLHGLRLTSLMILCWFWVLAAGLALWPACRLRLRGQSRDRVQSFVMQALALMSALWIIVFAALWGTLLRLAGIDGQGAGSADPSAILVPSVLRALIPALLVVILVGLASGWVQIAKMKRLRRLDRPSDYLANADSLAEANRLIVSRSALHVLGLFFPLMLVVVILSFAAAYPGLPGTGWLDRLVGGFGAPATRDMLVSTTGPVVGVMALAAAGLVGALRGPVARGIAIFTDILAYLNNYSWVSAPGAGAARAAGEMSGYWMRDRIRDRLSALVTTLIRDEAPDELVLISHSQGTVIAIDVIDRDGAGWLAAMGQGARLSLVTMGSPYTHLYNRYFPTSFPAHRDRGALLPVGQTGSDGRSGLLSEWLNFLRIDDFVGTHIDAARNLPQGASPPMHSWPRDIAVAARGHPGYWTDIDVAAVLAPALAD